MKTGRVMKKLNISRSNLYNYVFVRNSLNDNSKESHQRVRDGRDT